MNILYLGYIEIERSDINYVAITIYTWTSIATYYHKSYIIAICQFIDANQIYLTVAKMFKDEQKKVLKKRINKY